MKHTKITSGAVQPKKPNSEIPVSESLFCTCPGHQAGSTQGRVDWPHAPRGGLLCSADAAPQSAEGEVVCHLRGECQAVQKHL